MSKSLIPAQADWGIMKEIGKMLLDTRFLPEAIKSPQQAVAIMLKGRELDIPPMQALSQINVIKGKPAISAELMLALIYRNCPQAQIEWKEMSDKIVSCKVKRSKEGSWQNFKFDWSDAEQAGLAKGFVWKQYPRAMLRSRCISEMARAVFPDAIMGCSYTPEELGANVNEDGEIINIVSDSDSGTVTHQKNQPVKAEKKDVYTHPKSEKKFESAGDYNKEPEPEKAIEPEIVKDEPKQTSYGYQGTKSQQDTIKKIAISKGLDEEYWEELHENMLGKSKQHLEGEIALLMQKQASDRKEN